MNPVSTHPLASALIDALTDAPPPPKRNTQLYENNTLADDIQATEYYSSDNKLFGDRKPNLAIKCERPEHRMIVYLKAQGLSNKEIADKTGYGYQWVCQIVRQPWFRARFVTECEEAGVDAIKAFLATEALPSLEALREVRDSEESKDTARVAAANSLLDRFLGKPVARVETEDTSKGLDDALATVDDLEKQVASLRAQNGLAETQPPQS